LPTEVNELLEITTVIGLVLKNSKSNSAMQFLRDVRALVDVKAPEVEIAMVRIDPELYITEEMKFGVGNPATIARGLREFVNIKKDQPSLEKSSEFVTSWLRDAIECHPKPSQRDSNPPTCYSALDISPLLEAYAAFTPKDLSDVARRHLADSDVVVRSTAAELLGQESSEANTRALVEALPGAMRDADNDAAIAILDALAKQKSKAANDAIKTALDSKDHLLRRRAVALLKANGVGDFSDRIGTVQTRNTDADYRRAIARIGKKPTATVLTTKGSFTIEFLPDDAPLNVDNFIQLAKKGYFNGQTIPRVVPNFVVQAGDPRGDQNGGPGYTIRCEINELLFERAAVGMALSGKDTGGSQWFVTHSPQPHLDGGYTIFGHVIRGMEVVDQIARGDRIVRVIINER
jgi:cyclophilin family peptidyl-prolyl cis-trans isomerase